MYLATCYLPTPDPTSTTHSPSSPSTAPQVSAVNSFGVKDMMEDIKKAMGFRADLWVVGAQNAGKSSLITAMKRLGGTAGKGDPTIAPMPGTTLGLLKVSGIPLGPKHRTFDTPGVPHVYQMTSLLAPEEVRMLLPSRRLKARTYRVPVGSCVLIGAVARLDLVEAPGSSIYLTVFVSDEIATHMGKIEGVEERLAKHGGDKLQPPLSSERMKQLPQWVPRNMAVEGGSWKQSSVDIAIAGLGWVGVGVAGAAKLRVWTYDKVGVTVHSALIPDFAKDFQRPGFSSILPQGKAKGGAGKKK
jgi:ribosome biogenesis GTPase A